MLSEQEREEVRKNPLFNCSCGKSLMDCQPKLIEETFAMVAQAEENVRTGNTSYKTSHPHSVIVGFVFHQSTAS